MSILDRLHADHHLDDAGLMDLWVAARLEKARPEKTNGSHPHLASCGPCRSRYAAMAAWADGLRHDAHAEADDVFTPERLAAQQASVFRRLEAMERPARVILFPRFGRAVGSNRSNVQRWIGAAAAAGLFVGLAAGQFMDLRWIRTQDTTAQPAVAQTTQSARTANPVTAVPAALSDEELFYSPADRRSVRPLEAIDALTPRSRDLDLPR